MHRGLSLATMEEKNATKALTRSISIARNRWPSMEQVAYSEFDDMHLLIQSDGAIIDARE
jgi:hypothetical protein